MQCFAHPTDPAVAVCRGCLKGVCRACAIELDRGVACSEACRTHANLLSRLQQASIRNMGLVTAQRVIHPLLALVLLGMATYLAVRYRPDTMVWFLYAMGAIFALTSIVSWLRRDR